MADTKVVITGDTRQAQTSISDLLTKMDALSGRSLTAAGAMNSLASAAGPLAAAFSVASIGHFVKGAIDAADGLNDLSQRIGISVKDLAGYQLAAEQSGTSLESIGKGVKGLSIAMLEHGDSLKAAGITAKDADGAMRQLSDLFSAMPDGIEKTALATKLFGKAGLDLIPMLNLGSKGLEESAEKSAKYAATMALLAPQADKFNDSLAELSLSGKSLGLTIVNDMMPGLNNIISAMSVAAREGGILQAVWVGLGGVAEELADRPVRNLDLVNKEIVAAQNALAGLEGKRGQKNGWLNDWASGTGEEQFQAANQRLANLFKERGELEARAAEQSKKSAEKGSAAAAELSKKNAEMQKAASDLLKSLGVGGSGSGGKSREASAYDSIVKVINEKITAQRAELDAGQQLTASQKLRIDLEGRLESSIKKMTATEVLSTRAAIDRTVALAEEIEERSQLDRLLDDVDRRRAESIAAIEKETEQTVEETARLREQAFELLNGRDAIEQRRIARIDEELVAKRAALDRLDENSKEAEAIRKSIRAIEDRKVAIGDLTAAEAIKKQIDAQAEEWKRFTGDIEKSLTDALMNGFNKGDGFAKSFVKSIESYFKTAVIKLAVQGVMNPVMGTVGNALGMPGVGGSGGSAGSLLSTGNSLYNASQGGGMYGSFATSSLGQSLGLSATTTALSSVPLTSAPMYASASLNALAAGSTEMSVAAASMTEASSALIATEATASTALTTIGTAMPYVAAALLVANAVGLFGKGGGPKVGDYGIVGESGYKPIAGGASSGGDPLGIQKLTENLYAQVKVLENISGKKFGGLTIQQGYDFDPEGTAGNRGSRQIRIGGQIISGASGGGASQFWDSAAEGARALSVLNTSDLQALIKELGDPKLSTAADALMANFGELEKSLPAWVAAQDAQKALSQSLMTEAERAAAAGDELKKRFDALGVAMPTSIEGLKTFIGSLDLTTKSGQGTIAALQSLAPAFVAIEQQAQAMREALAQQMQDVGAQIAAMDMSPLTKSLHDIADATAAAIDKATKLSASEAELSRIRELGIRQANALINTQAAQAYTGLLNAHGKGGEAMQFSLSQAQSTYDETLGKLAGLLGKSVDQIKGFISDSGSLEQAAVKVWQMTAGDQSDVVIKGKGLITDLMNSATQIAGIQQQIDQAASAANSPAVAAAAAGADTSASESAASALADRKAKLQDRIDVLMGTKTEREIALRDELAGVLDADTQSLIKNIFALEDQKIAAEKAAQAAEQHARWQDRFDILTGVKTEREIALRNELAGVTDLSTQSLIRQVFALEDQKTAIDNARKAAAASLDTAMAAVQRAADAERKRISMARDDAQKNISTLSAVFDTVKTGASALRGAVSSMRDLSLRDARSYLSMAQALTSAGGVPDNEKLATAISTLQTDTLSNYVSTADYEYAQLVQAAKLDKIGEAMGAQKSVAQLQLDALDAQVISLDAQLEMARGQLDALRGIDNSVLSVADALRNFGSALSSRGILTSSASASPAVAAAAAAVTSPASASVPAAVSNGLLDANRRVVAAMSDAQYMAGITALKGPAPFSKPGEASYEAFVLDQRFPGFAVGTDYVPQDMLANIHQGEIIMDRSSSDILRKYGINSGAQSDPELLKEIKILNARMVRIEENIRRTAEATNGNPDRPLPTTLEENNTV